MHNTGKDLRRDLIPDASPDEDTAFPIVGIGASAGGLSAFIQFLEHLPATTGMAYIFVQHLDPSHNSLLPDLLVRVTKMPLCVAQDQMVVEADHVYVIPPNTDLTLEQGILHLVPRTQQSGLHLTIDHFFRSLAQDQGHQAIGVLLSGTGSDGTMGLQAIKAQGGITFAQDAQSAKYPQMPLHAITAGWVDWILPPEEIARTLSMLNRQSSLAATPLETWALSPAEQQDFMKIRLLLRSATNVDFLAYRSATLRRRILRRMARIQIDQISAYVTYLNDHPAEVEALSQEVLIHVTSFFRDPGSFEALARLVFPELVQHLLPGDPLRLWVVGCSTGEEAYSLAICLLEYLEEHALSFPFQLFATDLDAAAIKEARAGIYLRKTMQAVSPQRLQRFFLPLDRSGEQYQISKAIREHCVFARQNVANDPPFSQLDLVSCRNVLIYLTPGAQEQVLQTLHYALKPHGFLLLGASESVGLSSSLFRHVEPHLKLFLKKSWGRDLSHGIIMHIDEPASTTREANSNKKAKEMMNKFDVQQEVDHLLQTTYAPASVVIDDEMLILHIRGRTGPYLEPAPGKADFHLLKWVRDGLKLGVRTAIQAAQKENHPVSREGLQVSGTTRMVRVTVVPLQGASTPHCLLVLFEESPSQAPQVTKTGVTGALFGRQGKRLYEAARMDALEQELTTTQAEMQAILEERDRSNERLQTANEEVRSSNEELQSLNEELETSQAELQASNEELTITNQELLMRNEQLRIAQDYAASIVETVREPLVVLDADLRLLSANTAFYQFFQVTPSETEHLFLSELGNGQWDLPQLRHLLEEVQATNQSFHDIEVEHHFPAIGHKIMLLNGRKMVREQEGTRNHLILLAMEDITARRELELRKETFLGMVGHELKTPLTSAKGFLQILQWRVRKAGDEQTAIELEKIDTHLDKLAHLIRSLLDVSALETGTLSIHPTPFAVEDLVREIVEEREHSAPGRLRLEEITPAEAYGDRERTGQVLLNLLTNALKYSAPTDPVWVKTSVNEDRITLSVRDLGPGIPLDQQARIFERFARVDQPRLGNKPGMGLGLYIAEQIISQQGERIWVESSPGKGSIFFFTLPYAPHTESDKKE